MNESTSPNMYIKPDYSAQVEQWLAEGNQITQMTRTPVKIKAQFGDGKLKPKQRARLEAEMADRNDIIAFGKWLDQRPGRAQIMANKLKCAYATVSQIKTFNRSCTRQRMVEIKHFMKVIQKEEANKNMTTRDGEGR